MAEPTTTSAASIALTGASIVALFPGVDAAQVLGAFAGAAVFVMSSQDMSTLRKLAFLALAFFAGILAAKPVAVLLDTLLPERVDVPASVGALVASAMAIKVLLALINRADTLNFSGGDK
ncbi:putative holin [Paludibacterium paludis]|uniref:Phage holin n=1 Tax=Paludibacterium paludis TaxID=1225769 RepID=A0A918NX97_9NEIS|nr:putative holin [Paludibacterium paludis]GGY03863.1 hypothetical protein GCM10011289_02760 [Paludibacterium paludis]